MISRERVSKAVNFQKPDRIPIDLGSMRASGINAFVYDQLKKRLGIDTPTKIHDTMQILAEIEMEVLELYHADVVPLDAGDVEWTFQDAAQGVKKHLFCGLDVFFQSNTDIAVEEGGSWTLRNADGEAYARMPKDGFYFDFLRPHYVFKAYRPLCFQTEQYCPGGET